MLQQLYMGSDTVCNYGKRQAQKAIVCVDATREVTFVLTELRLTLVRDCRWYQGSCPDLLKLSLDSLCRICYVSRKKSKRKVYAVRRHDGP